MKFVFVQKNNLFLGKSTKTAVNRAALFDSNMHKIVGWGFAPFPTGGAYSQCSRIRIFRFFQISKNLTFYVFLKLRIKKS